MRNKIREAKAERVAVDIQCHVPNSLRYPKVGIILGTGWADTLMNEVADEMKPWAMFRLADLSGFEELRDMTTSSGHHRELYLGTVGGKTVAMLRGRIHLNESHKTEELKNIVRLQVEALIKLGVKHLILTNAAGSLLPEIKVGDIVAHDGFVTLFAPPLPLEAGEFVSPEDTLKNSNNIKIIAAAIAAGLVWHMGAGAMVRGPGFEGRKRDKRILRQCGASMAMMSILPEAAVAALYQDPDEEVRVYAVSFITNTASEEHSHPENQRRAAESSAKLGFMLSHLVSSL